MSWQSSRARLRLNCRFVTSVVSFFDLQFVVGFFSFLILLCCENGTAGFRASLVPIHATFGILTFMLAIATCLTGLTEKAFLTQGYVHLPTYLNRQSNQYDPSFFSKGGRQAEVYTCARNAVRLSRCPPPRLQSAR